MIFDSPQTRDLYSQTGTFSFLLSVELSNTTGRLDFGFSGAHGTLNYRFQSGRLLDNESRFIGAYQLGERVSLSGAISASTYDVYLNDQPRALGVPRTAGDFNALYIYPRNLEADFDLFVDGDSPNYQLSSLVTFETGENVTLTGYIKNLSSQPFKLLSGDYHGNSNFELTSIPVGDIVSSGALVFTAYGELAGGLSNLPITLYTDFGTLDLTLLVSGNNSPPPSYYIDVAGGNLISNGAPATNYTVQFGDPNGTLEIVPWLRHVSGSGVSLAEVEITGQYNGTITGYIVGSGYATREISITGTSAYASGVISTTVSGFRYASGNISTTIPVLMTGQVTGVGYTGAATGIYALSVNGEAVNGERHFHGSVSDNILEWYTVNPVSVRRATGWLNLNGIQDDDLFWIGSEEEAVVYPYSFTTAASLVDYLNDHTGTHLVTANYIGNTVHFTSIYDLEEGNGTALRQDQCNKGSVTQSNQFLTGGGAVYGRNYNPTSSSFFGRYDVMIPNSGTFTYNHIENVTGSAMGVSAKKEPSSVWAFRTGDTTAPNAMRDTTYNSAGYFSGGALSSSQRRFYVQVSYNNSFDSVTDVVDLLISGRNQPVSATIRITGTP